MRRSFTFFMVIIICGLYSCNIQTEQACVTIQSDSIKTALLFSHLRNNFDDIHDVSMRFHHKDERLSGKIHIQTEWKDGKLIFSQILKNETGDKEFGLAIADKLKNWQIKNLIGNFSITIPFRIKLVGTDNPDFQKHGMITGKIVNEGNKPLHNALINFISENGNFVAATRTNREGIYVKTLIKPGKYIINVSKDEYRSYTTSEFKLGRGEHYRVNTQLVKLLAN